MCLAGTYMSAPSESCSPLSLLSVSGDLPTWGRESWYPQLLPTIPRGKRGGEKSRINKRIGRSTAARPACALRIAMCFLKANRTPQVLMQIHSS